VQSVKAMLFDRTATANAKPELEIYADDVKCAHGATVGELDSQAMFYLASRGLPPETAKALLLQAFIAEVFGDVADEGAKLRLEEAALAALEVMI
jgi:Fe-S cluster assembly protein SufD